jgi:hypothetical protein
MLGELEKRSSELQTPERKLTTEAQRTELQESGILCPVNGNPELRTPNAKLQTRLRMTAPLERRTANRERPGDSLRICLFAYNIDSTSSFFAGT